MIFIPNEARWELSDLQDDKGDTYVDAIWARRDAAYRIEHGEPVSRGGWPFVRASAQPAESVTVPFKARAR